MTLNGRGYISIYSSHTRNCPQVVVVGFFFFFFRRLVLSLCLSNDNFNWFERLIPTTAERCPSTGPRKNVRRKGRAKNTIKKKQRSGSTNWTINRILGCWLVWQCEHQHQPLTQRTHHAICDLPEGHFCADEWDFQIKDKLINSWFSATFFLAL